MGTESGVSADDSGWNSENWIDFFESTAWVAEKRLFVPNVSVKVPYYMVAPKGRKCGIDSVASTVWHRQCGIDSVASTRADHHQTWYDPPPC